MVSISMVPGLQNVVEPILSKFLIIFAYSTLNNSFSQNCGTNSTPAEKAPEVFSHWRIQ